MGYRTYEADRHGRITIYPSINNPARKGPGIFKTLIKKLIGVVTEIRKNGTGRP